MDRSTELRVYTFRYSKYLLTENEEAAYQHIIREIRRYANRIALPLGIEHDVARKLFRLVRNESPMFFHLSHHYELLIGRRVTIVPQYIMNQEEYEKRKTQIKQFLAFCKKSLQGRNRYEMLRGIHNFIVSQVTYSEDNSEWAYNALGPLIKRKAVCEGIAKAFKLMCDVNEIPCIVVSGSSTNNDRQDTGDNHAWNMVKIDGKWYHVDATFDTTINVTNPCRSLVYDYFCRSDAVIQRNHRFNQAEYPESKQDLSIYKKHGYYAANVTEFEKLVVRQLQRGKDEFSIEYSISNVPSEKMLDCVKKQISKYNFSRFSFIDNENMGVFHCALIKAERCRCYEYT